MIPSGTVGREVCGDFARSSRLEWLETDGSGGFAMGTVACVNTRRYHGLLIAALPPNPMARQLLLSRLEESVEPARAGDPWVDLATVQYPGVVTPAGVRNLIRFSSDPFPSWVFDAGGAEIEKTLFLIDCSSRGSAAPGQTTLVVQYRSTARRWLRVAPFLAFRDYHSLRVATPEFNGTVSQERGPSSLILRTRPLSTLPELRLHASPAATFAAAGDWYYRTEYLAELDRGLDFREDLFRLGTFSVEVAPDQPFFLVATLGDGTFDAAGVAALTAGETRRRSPRPVAPVATEPARKAESLIDCDSFSARLRTAAAQFVVQRQDATRTVIAGYPWFSDWGRDTMISLPGIFLSTGRLGEAREVLRGFLSRLDGGLIPNRFPDRPGEEPEYNTVDATLWMFEAVQAWVEAGGDLDFVRSEFYPAAEEIISWHRRGTHHAIQVDAADGLLAAGEPGVALTWMDARTDGRAITPRIGKPVEINALYYNALRLVAQWAGEFGHTADQARWRADADRVEESFGLAFWNPARGCLHDVIGRDGTADPSLRPNQLIAASLRYPLVRGERLNSMLAIVEQQLLTPYGLRTLAPGEPGYQSRYRGGPLERDGAYHQGTVWPWLLGPYVRAWLRAHGRSPAGLAQCRTLLAPLQRHLDEACLGSISEVFDAEEPHLAGGAPAQAWSVAELLRLLSFELDDSRG